MATPAGSWKRTHTCGELRASHVGEEVCLNGWVDSRRNLGGIYFVDLRDREGLTQLVIPEAVVGDVHLSPEDCISARGKVIARVGKQINKDRPTGEVELELTELTVLSPSKIPPFEILDDLDTAIELRLRYRYLDLRRAPMQQHLTHRSNFVHALRTAFIEQGFNEVETPILTRATPEGARDYLVPSRVHEGKFYALPQSPQIFKQILMVAGTDKYFQIARCFRDEDLRADRQPEFTQLDMEMSFVEEEDVFVAWERALKSTFQTSMGVELELPFPRMTWDEAMERFGCDKPDTRFGMELSCLKEWASACDFKVFSGAIEGGGRVMSITVESGSELSRKQITNVETYAKEYGAKGLAWWKPGPDGGTGPLARFLDKDGSALEAATDSKEGDLVLFMAGDEALVRRVLGELRVHLGRTRGLCPAGVWNFLWVTRFPMFEWDAETERWSSSHHPFTAPEDWSMETDPAAMASRAYDLVLNGWELGSGSVRIHRQDVQAKVFELLGLSEEEQQAKFGFLLEALSFGAPPHAGFALGIDRVVALTLGLDNIRDVIAFPKTTSAADLMCEAPSTVAPEQLSEVHIAPVRTPEKGA